MKTPKTNAARLLDAAKIAYSLKAYTADEQDLSAVHVADQIGAAPETVFKTLVLHGDKNGYFVCVIPGPEAVDLKKAAKISGNKNCAMIAQKDLLPLTGYVRGGCSPIGMKKRLPVYVHNSATEQDTIYISAGQRGLQLGIAPRNLVQVTGGSVQDIVILN